ncbi:MAG: protease [Phycisphaeraceae bacterium]|nr:protease [Phycisphaeraceae bacterium]|tara:strand:- start:546 stop:1088 length:543 start_codon:yes stop_codon:yes gene_type:complete
MEMDIAMNTQHILVLTGPDYEDLELWYPKLRLLEAGRTVTVAAPEAGATYHGKNGYPCISDACIHDIDSQDYQGLILPGGWMPDKLRREPKALELVREFNESAKMIAAICHGGWIAISAGVYHGVKVTGSLGIKDDLINAGATWVDEPVVVDRHFISSRKPEDLPAFCKGIFQVLEATIA